MTITVITPTYNRENTLPRLYHSIVEQLPNIDKWIIIDDGSDDGTGRLVANWQKQKLINIHYHWQRNQGKHRAINYALAMDLGDWVFIMDSDDWLAPDSFNFFKYDLGVGQSPLLAGIIAGKSLADGQPLAPLFPDESKPVSLWQLENDKLMGERTLIFKSSVVKNLRFPEIHGEKFCTEAVFYDLISRQGLKFYPINRTITICEYQQSGLSNRQKQLLLENPGSYKLYFSTRIDSAPTVLVRAKAMLKYLAFKHLSSPLVPDYHGPYHRLVQLCQPLAPIMAKLYKLK